MLGIYNIRLVIINLIGKKRFDVGINGNVIK